MKKRILSIVLTLCMVLMIIPHTAFAETSGDWEYSVSDVGGVTITKYKGSSFNTNVTIPDTIAGKPVKVIGDRAFEECKTLTSISIPNSVTSIGALAFDSCSMLASITIPNSVTSIGASAFSGCKKLESITIPNSVTSIGISAFSNCHSLKNIEIPDSVTFIANSAFRECKSLESITIPDHVTSIGDSAFFACVGLKSITIPDSVTSIGNEAFRECRGLESITIPDSVTSIGNEAFKFCNELTSISISDRVTSIEDMTFYCCKKLTSVNIPNGVTSIGYGAFYSCESLTSISIPDSVTSIGNEVFKYCSSLASISIPDSVTSIGNETFKYCSSLASIFLPDNNLDVSSANIPSEATQVRYSLNTNNGEVTITGITLGSGKTEVTIPARICDYPVVAVKNESLLDFISSHTCVGGTATCQTKATCGICKQEYGELGHHDFTKEDKNIQGALKAEGTCHRAAVYYYSCAICNQVGCNDNPTFMGELDSSNHNIEKISAKDATVTETGNKEYWHCLYCGKYFADEHGTNEIKLDDIVIKKLSPEIIDGKGQSIIAGENKELTFRSNAAFSDFIRVEFDGKTLDEKNYTVKEGSTIVTLNADYVEAILAGEHTISIVSTSGTATTTFTVDTKKEEVNAKVEEDDVKVEEDDVKVEVDDVKASQDKDTNSPKTGDKNHMTLWIALLFVSGGILTVISIYSKKKKRSARYN